MNHRFTMKTDAWWWAAFAGVITLAILLALPSLWEPHWYGDEGQFAAIAHDIRHGNGLYRDSWDIKPPFIFWTYALVQAIGGVGMLPLHLAGMIALLVVQAAVMITAARISGPARAVVAGWLVAVLLGGPVFEGDLALTEKFLTVFTSLAVVVFVVAQRRPEHERVRWYAVAGVLIGIAMNYKQVAFWDGAAIGVLMGVFERRPMRSWVTYSAGIAAVHVLVVAWFVQSGAVSEYWDGAAGKLPLYSGLARDPGPFLSVTRFAPALIVAGWLGVMRWRGERVGIRAMGPVWLAFAVAGSTSSTFGFPHYLLQVIPAFSLTVATLPFGSWRAVDARRGALVAALCVVAAIVLYAQFWEVLRYREQGDPIRYYRNAWAYATDQMPEGEFALKFDGRAITVEEASAAILADEPADDATLFVWGELAWIYPLTGLTNAGRYYTTFLAVNVEEARAEIAELLEADPPDYLVISQNTDGPFPELDVLAAERYEVIGSGGDWQALRLRGGE